MRTKRKPIKAMTGEELIDEFAVIQRWAGDDFAIEQITERESRRGYKIRDEILRRLAR